MKRYDNIKVAFQNLMVNKIRSLLSMLGIVIGTGSVIVVIALVNGARQATLESMAFGANDMVRVFPIYSEESHRFGKLTVDDLSRIARIPHVTSVLPDLSSEKEIRSVNGKMKVRLIGVDAEYFDIYGYRLSGGRKLTQSDITNRRPVCLLNSHIASQIFGVKYSVGERLRIDDFFLEVIGIVDEPARAAQTGKTADIFIPYETLFRVNQSLDFYMVEVRSEKGEIDRVKDELDKLIKENSHQAGLLEVQDPRAQLAEVEKWADAWMFQMIIIAGISLLVGGVGLMNVMLTTVAERTREVGLRKALGATNRKIQEQFLIESAALSGIGGFIGMVLGLIISYGIGVVSNGKIQVSVVFASLFFSFLFSLILGVIFGLYPASKAARLSPVEALRYE